MNYSRLQYNWKNMDNGTVQMEQRKIGIVGEILDNRIVRMDQWNNGTVQMEQRRIGIIGNIFINRIVRMNQWNN